MLDIRDVLENPRFIYIEIPDGNIDRFKRAMQVKRSIEHLKGTLVKQNYANILHNYMPGKVIFFVDTTLIINAQALLTFVENGGDVITPKFHQS